MGSLIAIVDDDPSVCEFLADRLQSKGYQVEVYNDALSILMRVRDEEKPLPNIIIMDMEMPLMSGSEATAAIKTQTNTKDIIIIILSAHIKGRHMGNALSSGADDICPKPFRVDDLIAKIERQQKKYDASHALK